MPKAAIEPPTNVGFLNSARSNIGWEMKCSATGKMASETPAMISETTTSVLPQPLKAGLNQPVDQGGQAEREQHESDEVDPAVVRRAEFLYPRQRDHDREDANRQIHIEDPVPAQAGRQGATEQRA